VRHTTAEAFTHACGEVVVELAHPTPPVREPFTRTARLRFKAGSQSPELLAELVSLIRAREAAFDGSCRAVDGTAADGHAAAVVLGLTVLGGCCGGLQQFGGCCAGPAWPFAPVEGLTLALFRSGWRSRSASSPCVGWGGRAHDEQRAALSTKQS
jgi:hypothetical protein